MPDAPPYQYVITYHPRFTKAAWEEVIAVDPDAEVVERLDVDAVLVRQGIGAEPLVASLNRNKPIFVQHLAPVQAAAKLDGTRADFSRLEAAVQAAAPIDPGTPFGIQCRKGQRTVSGAHGEATYGSRDVEVAVGTGLERMGLSANPYDYVQVVSIYLSHNRGYVGVSLARDNLTDKADEHRHRSRTGGHISRAHHKLAEALDMFGLAVDAATRALDLGAAPGGWTQVIVERGGHVVAVDPGALDPTLESHPLVDHRRDRIENITFEPGSFDLVVNDMNLEPVESAALMCAVAPWVGEGAPGVMTIKLMGVRPHRRIERASSVLAHAYDVVGVRHLHHNRQEVTCLLRRKPGPVADGWQDHIVTGRGRRAVAS
jgi:23S rRNA (cytidine2498-2'-O)-methyltransferase